MKRTLLTLMLATALMAFGALAQMGSGWMGYEDHQIENNLVFPHIALGQGYTTSVILMNPGLSGDLVGTLYFYNQDGTPMSVVYQNQTMTSVPVNLSEGVTQYFDLTAPDANLAVGWGMLQVDESNSGTSSGMGGMGGMGSGPMGHPMYDHVFGSVIYARTADNALDTQVGVFASRYQMGYYMGLSVPVIVSDSTNTGVAVVNTGSEDLTITLNLIDGDGNRQATQSVTLPAGNQAAYYVNQLFPDFNFANFRGSMELRTDQDGMVALALLQSGNVLTSLPMAHIPDAMPDGYWDGSGPHM